MRRGQKQKLALWSIKMDGELRAKSTENRQIPEKNVQISTP